MNQWLGLGIFLLGLGVGALLTRIAEMAWRPLDLRAREMLTSSDKKNSTILLQPDMLIPNQREIEGK